MRKTSTPLTLSVLALVLACGSLISPQSSRAARARHELADNRAAASGRASGRPVSRAEVQRGVYELRRSLAGRTLLRCVCRGRCRPASRHRPDGPRDRAPELLLEPEAAKEPGGHRRHGRAGGRSVFPPLVVLGRRPRRQAAGLRAPQERRHNPAEDAHRASSLVAFAAGLLPGLGPDHLRSTEALGERPVLRPEAGAGGGRHRRRP